MKWDIQLARDCCDASRDAYREATIQTGRAHALVRDMGEFCLLALRGTAEPRDWITDAEFDLHPTPFGWIHRGFWESSSEMAAALANWQPGKPVVLAGHSLGGAQSVVLAGLLAQRMAILAAYTFGQPRVGDSTWRQRFAELRIPLFRFVNEIDIVSRVPGVAVGYSHAGNLIYLSASGKPRTNPGLGWRLLHDLRAIWADVRRRKLGLLADHSVELYRERLR